MLKQFAPVNLNISDVSGYGAPISWRVEEGATASLMMQVPQNIQLASTTSAMYPNIKITQAP
jgi:hypothetical protein